MNCYICNSNRFVDNHHYDCKEGKISPETVMLCRRCHRTYHDMGVEWFDDEFLDKAIAIENRRRKILYANLKEPIKPLELLKREDIRRSDYWNKIHGIVKQTIIIKEKIKAKQVAAKGCQEMLPMEFEYSPEEAR